MKKRLAALWAPFVIGFVLLMPASTFAASGYTFAVIDQHCIPGGHGHNPYFEVRLTAAGSTPSSRMSEW